MDNVKKLLALLLAMVMILCLAACGGDEKTEDDKTEATTSSSSTESKPQGSDPQETKPTEEDPSDEQDPPVEAVYTVSVHDNSGAPVEGVWVQICAGTTCVPKVTDANGQAFYTEEITGDGELVAKLISAPEGYALPASLEIPMSDGATEVGFTVLTEGETAYVYTVQVITTEDCGVEGAWVQICAGTTCVPKQTDVHGFAGYEEEITGDGDLTAKLINIPEGYELAEDGSMEIVFEDGYYDAIFVLKETN